MSVNSYGIGGSNVHVSPPIKMTPTKSKTSQFIIDSAASFGLQKGPISALTLEPQKQRTTLLLFSANHSESLKRIAENIEGYCRKNPERLDDLAYTLAQRREHLRLRSYCVVSDQSTPFAISAQIKSQGTRQVAFVFTGQGAQW